MNPGTQRRFPTEVTDAIEYANEGLVRQIEGLVVVTRHPHHERHDLFAEAGICVLFESEQVAIFKDGKSQQVFAVSNYDPIGKANVLSRGIVGSINGRLVVASPLYKQHFCLDTGACLEAEHQLKTYPIRVNDGDVQLSQPLA